MLSQKIRKMGTAKKHCKTHDILKVGGLSWGYVGLSWGQYGRILGLCWPILALCWPILGLCCPILGAMLAHLGAMLTHLEAYLRPCWAILSHKIRKMGKKGNSKIHLRATAGRGPNYVGPSCGYMLAYVGLMLTHVEPKGPKNGNSKKTL